MEVLNNNSDDIDEAYEKFEARKETDDDTLPDSTIDSSATKLDTFICVINKPLFFILFALNVALMLYGVSFTRAGTWLVYVGCLIEMVVSNLVLYHICYKIKLSKGKLSIHKIKAWKKALLFGGALLLGVIVSIGLAIYEVNSFANSIGATYQNEIIVDRFTDEEPTVDGEETTVVNENEIVAELAGSNS